MRDIFILACLLGLTVLGFTYPVIMASAYIWIDLFAPHQVTYSFLSTLPVGVIWGLLTILVLVLKRDVIIPKLTGMHISLILLFVFGTLSLAWAKLPEFASRDYEYFSKILIFVILLPFFLKSRLHIEIVLAIIVLAITAHVMNSGIKTMVGGGSYASLGTLTGQNAGLGETSTLALLAAMIIPFYFWAAKHSLLVPQWKILRRAIPLLSVVAIACIIGTHARAGLLALIAIIGLMLLMSKRRVMYGALTAVAILIYLPFAPADWTKRMSTIESYEEDSSAGTRLAMWEWSFNYARTHPLGGGFDVWRLSVINTRTIAKAGTPDRENPGQVLYSDRVQIKEERGRAPHSVYFEVLAELGFIGLALILGIFWGGIARAFALAKYFRGHEEYEWLSQLCKAMGISLVGAMIGSAFVGIAWQSTLYYFICILIAIEQIRLRKLADEREKERLETVGKMRAPLRQGGGVLAAR